MNIFILEDDILQLHRLENLVYEVCKKNNIVTQEIFTTTNSNLLIKKIVELPKKNVYFLDIDLHNEKKKGLEVAKTIRQVDSFGVLTFVTTHSEFAPITYAYKVSAYDFISKDWGKLEIKRHIQDALLQGINTTVPQADKENVFF